MPSSPSTPIGLIKKAEKTKSAKKSTKVAKRSVQLPAIPYDLPYNWAGNDQVIAAVLGCKTMGEFADYCRGKHLPDPAAYWAVYWAFQELLITQDAAGKVSTQQLPNVINHFCKDPKYWRLINDNPSTPITSAQMAATNNPQYQQAGELEKAMYNINTVKMLHFMLLHLDDHLNTVVSTAEHISGHGMRDWMLVYMVFSRTQTETRKRLKNKALFSKEDFWAIKSHGRNKAPDFTLVISDDLGEPAATDAIEGEQSSSEEEEDVERVEAQQNSLEERFTGSFTKENIELQIEMLQKFLAKEDTERSELSIDSKNRVINHRPPLSNRQRNRVIARSMAHLEVISDGLHGKMTDAPQTTAHAAEAMNRLATNTKVPEVDAQWLQQAEEFQGPFQGPGDKADADLRADWLLFQEMVSGGYVENDMAVGYMEACKNMNLDPKDPSWDINGGKCKLHPWQVIGADWLRRAKREGDISPLLADDCGLGKTIQTLAALYADYLDAKAGRILPPYRPTLIVAPGIIAINWVNDNAGLLRSGLSLWLWQGRQVDAGNSISVPKGKILDMTDQEIKQWIDGLDTDDPETMREVIVTTYGTGPIRSLYVNGRHAHMVSKERAQELQARRDELTRFPQTDVDALDDDAGEEAGTTEMPEKPDDKWSCTLAGRFYRVCCDESHKAKSTRTNTFRWVQELAPTNGYMFLSATPMPNTIEDMKCYLMLNWKEEWATDEVDPKFPLAAIGLWSMDPRSDTDDIEPEFPTTDCDIIATKAHLNPKLFRASITPEGGMMTRIAARLLPAIQSQLSMRRTMSSVISWTDADGTEHAVRVGEEVPPFTCKTIELAYKPGYNFKRFKDYHRILAEEMGETTSGIKGPHEDSGKVGKRNMAIHKRLQVLSTSIHAERFTQSYNAQLVKTGVDEMNTLHEWGNDRGLSTFFAHATLDPNASIPSSRMDMAKWLLKGSPKLCWLANYVNEKKKKGKRVAIFVVWPVCQWLIEATFELLGFDCVSIRSEKTLKLRQEAINTFCNLEARCDGCVMSYACAGTGLNYQKATPYMIHVEIPQNLATWLQGNGRLHRLGQLFRQEITTLCMDASYDRTMLANICHKYLPEMIAALHIPNDAQIDGEARPDASLTAERATFDEAYSYRVIADMIGLREPEMNRDAKNPPRRQIRPEDADVLSSQPIEIEMAGVDPALEADAPPSVPDSKRLSKKRKAPDYASGNARKRVDTGVDSSPLKGKGNAMPSTKPASQQANRARTSTPPTTRYPLSRDIISVDADSDEDPSMGVYDSQYDGPEYDSDPPSKVPENEDPVPFDSSQTAIEPDGGSQGPAQPAPRTPAPPVLSTNPASLANRPRGLFDRISMPVGISGHGLGHLFGKGSRSTAAPELRLGDHRNAQHAGSSGPKPTQDGLTDSKDVYPVTPKGQGRFYGLSDDAQGPGHPQQTPAIGSGAVQQPLLSSPMDQRYQEQRKIREQRDEKRRQKQLGIDVGPYGVEKDGDAKEDGAGAEE